MKMIVRRTVLAVCTFVLALILSIAASAACAGSGSGCGQDQCQDKGADSQRCSSNDSLHKFLHILVLSLSCILR